MNALLQKFQIIVVSFLAADFLSDAAIPKGVVPERRTHHAKEIKT
jgi:hypothetical protein